MDNRKLIVEEMFMRKTPFLIVLIFVMSYIFPTLSFAQGMVENENNHTAREEAEGKAVWEKFQAKELSCEDLSDDDFGALGEYFMGQMAGSSHEAMNNMMTQMMGKEGEEQMHAAMGKRMSGCEPNAPMPQSMVNNGIMPKMMSMMMGGGDNLMMGNMMGNFGANPTGWFGFSWIFMILFWGFAILGIIALIKWVANQGKREVKGKSALDILKERYAKGEIDKEEFEEKKKDLAE